MLFLFNMFFMMKYFVLLCIILFLSSCFWWGGSQGEWLRSVSHELFSLSLPENWSEVSWDTLPSPKIGRVELAYSGSELRWWYANNIVIISEKNVLSESSEVLFEKLPSYLDSTLEVFHKKNIFPLEFPDGDTSKVLEFHWKYNNTTPYVTYLQTVKSCGERVYYMNISIGDIQENYDRYRNIFSTFSCKN